MFLPLSTIKKFRAEIVFVAWLRDCLSAFTRKHFKKVLKPSVILFAIFSVKFSSFTLILEDMYFFFAMERKRSAQNEDFPKIFRKTSTTNYLHL